MSNRKLEELFNMAPSDDTEDEPTVEEVKNTITTVTETRSILDKIDAALPSVKDLSASDEEMDELAKLSKEAFENLIDVGLSVDPRFGGQILQVASAMMTNSINAKNAKIEKKLRMVELQLRKAALDQKERALALKVKPDEDESEQGTGVVMDRNALLREILANSDKGKK
jgi:hypothetical protein